MQRKTLYSSLILSIWLAGTAYAFWWFQAKDLRPFDQHASAMIEEAQLNEALGQLLATLNQPYTKSAYLLHFWQPGCSCNRFNQSHVKTIAEKYWPQHFELITISRPHADYSDQQLAEMAKAQFGSKLIIDHLGLLTGKSRIPAAPAAAVISDKGRLAYFGPYSDSTFCGVGGTAFVERVADLLVQGEQPSLINTMVFGCFCDWDSNKTQQT